MLFLSYNYQGTIMDTEKFRHYRTLAKAFQILFNKNGSTKNYVAYSIGISPSSVSNHINGKSIPDIYTIAKYCEFYKISLTQFYHLVEYTNDPTTSPIITSDIRQDAVKLMITS